LFLTTSLSLSPPLFVHTGVLYGMGPQATTNKLGIEVAQASKITQSFFDHFRQIRTWIQQIKR
jgi:DNA polymerase I-like protein with 3'-5' exonuclease and polymerase domains